MNGKPCPDCGQRFNSERHLKLHREHACDGATSERDQTGDGSTPSTPSEPNPEVVAMDATGTLSEHHEDRGFGFAVTTDLTQGRGDEEAVPESVFVHVGDVPDGWMEEGDRLKFDIVDTKKGLRATDIDVLQRGEDRDDWGDTGKNGRPRLRFGQQKDDTMYGGGHARSTNDDIESFEDERKFR